MSDTTKLCIGITIIMVNQLMLFFIQLSAAHEDRKAILKEIQKLKEGK